MRDGFVYVVNTKGYVEEALASAASLRRAMPSAEIAIVAPESLFLSRSDLIWIPMRGEYDGPIAKVEMTSAPFDRTVFLDSDTYVTSSLADLFDILATFDLALAHDPMRGWDYETAAARAFTELNTGVVAFRRTPAVAALFEDWWSTYQSMRATQGLRNDQPSFREALWRAREVRHATLPSEYHLVAAHGAHVMWDAKLLHGRNGLQQVASSLNERIGPRTYMPVWGVLPGFRGRFGLVSDYARLTTSFLRALVAPRSTQPREAPVKWE